MLGNGLSGNLTLSSTVLGKHLLCTHHVWASCPEPGSRGHSATFEKPIVIWRRTEESIPAPSSRRERVSFQGQGRGLRDEQSPSGRQVQEGHT